MFRTILTVSGLDPCGGAGLHADVKTAKALGFHSISVITALTVQNTCKVFEVQPVNPEIISNQLKALLEDTVIGGVKIGLIPNLEVANVVKKYLKRVEAVKVLDPVLSATAGGKIGDKEGYKLLARGVDVITPNLREAKEITGLQAEPEKLAKEIYEKFGCSVVITGGEMGGKDLIYDGRVFSVEAEFSLVEIHGTGCVYSTALTCYLAKGNTLEDASRLARLFLLESVKRALRIGKCHPVVNP
jgi:hydroxymethylpyrimidine/phosphomethylpyrimidine kinase